MDMHRIMENVLPNGSVTGGLAILALAVALGIALGNIRIAGIRLGVAAVLFSALLFAQLGLTINEQVLEYLRDFSLVLFVYTIGLQTGPGFVASLRAEGLRLNLLAVATIVLGALMTAGIILFAGLPRARAAGLFTGGFATTPALAAGQEAIRQLADRRHYDPKPAVELTNLAYSVAYPFGLTGPILLVIFFRILFRVDVAQELKQLAASEEVRRPPLTVEDIEVTNEQLNGVLLRDEKMPRAKGLVYTRLLRGSVQSVPTAITEIRVGDVLRAIGPKPALDEVIRQIGKKSRVNLAEVSGALERGQLVVTHRHVLGKSLRELDLTNRYGVTLARITRAGVDLPATASLKLHFGDSVIAIGPTDGLADVEKLLGNSAAAVNNTPLVPIFFGMWLGVIIGSIPIPVPGLNTSIRIGMAGGPMLAAIFLSRLGNIGSVVWYMPPAASQVLRDFGMALFLACVGFQSGDHFIQKLVNNGGFPLVGWGALVTLVPMCIVGLFARIVMKMNFITLSGLIGGAMTSSPTLAFANEATSSNVPAVAYATVYPLSMLVPVFCSQILVTCLMR